jgi:hypothetical protein
MSLAWLAPEANIVPTSKFITIALGLFAETSRLADDDDRRDTRARGKLHPQAL